MFYVPGDEDFEDVLHYDGWGFAADNRNCPYNASTDAYDYAQCHESARFAAEENLNVYLDPNVPEETYHICGVGWIGDNNWYYLHAN